MGWIKVSKQITTFTNCDGKSVDIIKNYGKIDVVALKTVCGRFYMVGEADTKTQANQNNTMMSNCLSNSLPTERKV